MASREMAIHAQVEVCKGDMCSNKYAQHPPLFETREAGTFEMVRKLFAVGVSTNG